MLSHQDRDVVIEEPTIPKGLPTRGQEPILDRRGLHHNVRSHEFLVNPEHVVGIAVDAHVVKTTLDAAHATAEHLDLVEVHHIHGFGQGFTNLGDHAVKVAAVLGICDDDDSPAASLNLCPR